MRGSFIHVGVCDLAVTDVRGVMAVTIADSCFPIVIFGEIPL